MLASRTREAKPGRTVFELPASTKVESLHLPAGDYDGWFDFRVIEPAISLSSVVHAPGGRAVTQRAEERADLVGE